MEKLLNYEEFEAFVISNLANYLPEELSSADIKKFELKKTNETPKRGVRITPEGSNISPHIYLEAFYRFYLESNNINETLIELSKVAEKEVMNGLNFANITEEYRKPEFAKSRVILAVINAEKNQKLLEEVPHIIVEDLAIIYKILLKDNEATITVKNEHLLLWNMKPEELHSYAVKNTEENLPAKITSMNDFLLKILVERGYPEEEALVLIDRLALGGQMFIVSNKCNIYGASNIFNKEALSEISKIFNGDLFLIPSSIHEVLAVNAKFIDPESLNEMVRKVNSQEVMPEEVLSDHVYKFDCAEQTVKIVA